MALVQVKQVVRVGLLEKVSRFVSPPNPSGSSSFLWKSDSFSRRGRNLLLSRMMDYQSSLFSTTTQVATASSSPLGDNHAPSSEEIETIEEEETEVTSSVVTDHVDILDRIYGREQEDHHKIAEASHDHYKKRDDGDLETLESTGFDLSKVSRPSGDE